MEKASKGIALSELIQDLDSNLTYGGARRISEEEAELLDQLDENFDYRIEAQREVDRLEESLRKTGEEAEKLKKAVITKCSLAIQYEILSEIGWQFSQKGVTLQQIGARTTRDFGSNPQKADEVSGALEDGVKIQEEIKDGKKPGEE